MSNEKTSQGTNQGGGQQAGQPQRPKPDKLQTVTKGKGDEPGVEKRA